MNGEGVLVLGIEPTEMIEEEEISQEKVICNEPVRPEISVKERKGEHRGRVEENNEGRD